MRDISARELKGHNILAVERFRDNTRWMIEFSVLRSGSYGSPGDEMRLFLTDCFPGQPAGPADGCRLAGGQGAGPAVCDPVRGVWLNRK